MWKALKSLMIKRIDKSIAKLEAFVIKTESPELADDAANKIAKLMEIRAKLYNTEIIY